ncbi:MAG TPA: cytochrome c3 family protein [Candidatus Limnocylindrales bacterium]
MHTHVARPGALRSAVVGMLVLGAWLLLAAMPVAADGGPHIASVNSGASTLTADGCAGCHRAHTAQGEGLLVTAAENLCLSCHGATATGATTDVEGGIQYTVENDGNGQPVAGALRGGGFVDARIDSAHSSRKSYPFSNGTSILTTFSSKVPVLAAGAAVTSAHLDLDGTGGVTARSTAWGNGEITGAVNAGPVVVLSCVSCHNPHGNGMYRILNPVTKPAGTGFIAVDEPGVAVDDATVPSGAGAAGTRNYTVQDGRTLQDVLATNAGPTAGDYWRRFLPWDLVPAWNGTAITNPAGMRQGDVPGYVAGDLDNLVTFKIEISAWCSSCHTRYLSGSTGARTNSGDPIYTYRHVSNARVECTQCHVSHGSNAAMTGEAADVAYPDGGAPTTVTDPNTLAVTTLNSRLLKIDNRGTCQACHDPTGTIPYDGSVISH